MKTVRKIISAIFILGSLTGIFAMKPIVIGNSFQGKWILDEAKSDFGSLPKERAAATSIEFVQDKKSVTFVRRFQNVPVASKETLTLDGKELEVKKEEYTALRSLSMSVDKQTLTVGSKYHATPEGQEPWDYTRVETYALAKDGKTMLLTRNSMLPDGKQEIVKAFYNRTK